MQKVITNKTIFLVALLIFSLLSCKKSEKDAMPPVPSTPTELNGRRISDYQVDLTWKDNSNNEIGFKIERKTEQGNFTEIGKTSVDINTFSDKSSDMNSNYTYRVYAYNELGKSVKYSNEFIAVLNNLQNEKIKTIKFLDAPSELVISKSFTLNVEIEFESGIKIINPNGLTISSSSPNFTIQNRKIIGAKSGVDFIKLSYNQSVDSIKVSVNPIEEVSLIDNYLKTPANNHSLRVPVVIINYIPTKDGLTKDNSRAVDYFRIKERSIEEVKNALNNLSKGIKFSAEEGSRYRGYKDKSTLPYVGIDVIKQFNLYEMPLMPAKFRSPADYLKDPIQEPDYTKIFQKIGLQNLVEKLGVKEVWFNVSHLHKGLPTYDSKIHNSQNLLVLAESNMSSPITGDISNSYRHKDDLPIYAATYVVYGFNYNGAFDIIDNISNNIHLRSHQIEIQLNERDKSLNKELFNNLFVGIPFSGGKPKGRSGNVHFPPNALNDYDYNNTTPVLSDIEDWKPDGAGQKKEVNKDTWNKFAYAWPSGVYSDSQSNWLVYWQQSIPNLNNNLNYKGRPLTNWWDIFYSWDLVNKSNKGLFD